MQFLLSTKSPSILIAVYFNLYNPSLLSSLNKENEKNIQSINGSDPTLEPELTQNQWIFWYTDLRPKLGPEPKKRGHIQTFVSAHLKTPTLGSYNLQNSQVYFLINIFMNSASNKIYSFCSMQCGERKERATTCTRRKDFKFRPLSLGSICLYYNAYKLNTHKFFIK